MENLLFTLERLARLPDQVKHSSPLFVQWARWPGQEGEALRAQLERVAAAVPVGQRARVLGPLLAPSSSDAQVRDSMNALLLAKTLSDQGWEVEHEPVVESGQTPDLRIRRLGEEYFVEVRHVLGDMHGWDKSARLHDAVEGMLSRRPIEIINANIDGGASLKGFRRHVEALKFGAMPQGTKVFQDRGVFVAYRVYETETEMPAIIGAMSQGIWYDDRPKIREAVTDKLTKYSMPLVVALDLVDVPHAFDSVRDAVCIGEKHFVIPIDVTNGGPAGPTRVEHKPNALIHQGSRDGARARERLQAVLAFECGLGSEALYQVSALLLANPAAAVQPFRAFRPIPRFVVVEQTQTDRRMAYLGIDDEQLADRDRLWRHTP